MSTRTAAPLQQLGGRVLLGVGGQFDLGARPHLRRESPRRRARQHPRDHVDVAQARGSSGELLRRGGQPGRQRTAIEAGARADLLSRGHPAPGLGPIPAEQIRERCDRIAVAPLGEHHPPHQIGHNADHQPIELPHHAFAHRQHGECLVRGRCRTRSTGQRLDRLDHEAVCGDDRGARHSPSLIEYLFEFKRDVRAATGHPPAAILRASASHRPRMPAVGPALVPTSARAAIPGCLNGDPVRQRLLAHRRRWGDLRLRRCRLTGEQPSIAGTRLAKPVSGVSVNPTGNGYWFTALDGGVFALPTNGGGYFGNPSCNAPAPAPVPANTIVAKGDRHHERQGGRAVERRRGALRVGGGHGALGPSTGTCAGYTGSIKPCPATTTVGVDCSGFARGVYQQA